jgi:hypothetical protein
MIHLYYTKSNMTYYTNIFAQTYGAGTYGSSTYQSGTTTATGKVAPGTSGGVLTNTGFDILLAVTLACAIVFMALTVRLWRKPAQKNE